MKKLKVLLIAPTYVDAPNTMYFPIGMSYLASYISSKGYEVDGFNMSNYGLVRGLEILKEKLDICDYDVIGIGALTVAFEQIQKLVISVRSMSEAKVVIGGGVTSCESELVIKEINPDYMVISEGELIFEELLNHIADSKKHPLPIGAWSKKGDEIVADSQSNAIATLDELPFPNYELMGIQEFMNLQTGSGWNYYKLDTTVGKYMPISASRSCPFKCTFCHHAGMGKYRKHSVKYAIEFITLMINRYKVKHLLIYDELFSMDKERVMEFCKYLKPLNITFMCQLRVDQINLEMLLEMKKAGCVEISYGIESGSEKVIKSMQKKTHVYQVENALKLTRKAKIGIQGNFLYGDPVETKETIDESLKFQERNKLYFTDWSMVIPYPGTVLHQLALSRNMIKDRVQFIKDVANSSKYLWNKPINLTQFSDEEFLARYAQLRELNDVNHRKALAKVKESRVIDSKHSLLVLECPHCQHNVKYEKIPFPFNVRNSVSKDRDCFYGFLGANIVCPDCRGKYHLLPKEIPHVKGIFKRFEEALDKFVESAKDNLVVMPAMDRYYSSVKSDTTLMNLKPSVVLDSREYRLGEIFMDRKVEKLSKENIEKLEDKKFIIFPWVEYESATKLLLDNGVAKENILSWKGFS